MTQKVFVQLRNLASVIHVKRLFMPQECIHCIKLLINVYFLQIRLFFIKKFPCMNIFCTHLAKFLDTSAKSFLPCMHLVLSYAFYFILNTVL